MLSLKRFGEKSKTTVCALCKQPIEKISLVDDLCCGCFQKTADILHVLEYIQNTSVANVNAISSFASEKGVVPTSTELGVSNNQVINTRPQMTANQTAHTASITRLKTGDKVELKKEVFIIGCSNEKTDYAIPEVRTLSRTHAKIELISGEYFLSDMNSKNGTRHNGNKILAEQKVALSDGDEFSLSSETFLFSINSL